MYLMFGIGRRPSAVPVSSYSFIILLNLRTSTAVLLLVCCVRPRLGSFCHENFGHHRRFVTQGTPLPNLEASYEPSSTKGFSDFPFSRSAQHTILLPCDSLLRFMNGVCIISHACVFAFRVCALSKGRAGIIIIICYQRR